MSMFPLYTYIIATLGVIFSMLTLAFQYKHLLSCLLSLEVMTLTLFLLMLVTSGGSSFEGPLCLVMITFGVCEASLGLAVLVSMIRAHGHDYVASFSFHKC